MNLLLHIDGFQSVISSEQSWFVVLLTLLKTRHLLAHSNNKGETMCVCVCVRVYVCVHGFMCKYILKSITGWVLQPTPFWGVSSMICMFIYIELLALNHLSYSKFSQL